MRRYQDLVYSGESLPPSSEWYWEALPTVLDVMKLLDAGDSDAATRLLQIVLPEFPELLDCFVEVLAERFGKKKMGAKVKNTEWRLLVMYDFYRLETQGTAAERTEQLKNHFHIKTISTTEDLLKAGRRLGRRLAADHEAEWEESQGWAADEPYPDTWDKLLERARRLKKSSG